MYKVFYNDRTVFLSQVEVDITNQPDSEKVYLQNKNQLKSVVTDFKNNPAVKNLYIIYHNAETLFEEFRQLYTLIEAAGGLVQNTTGDVLVIKRRNRWDFPKGKLEKGESPETAALREVAEECGIQKLHIQKLLDITYHTYQIQDKDILKKTYWYEMLFEGTNEPVPQEEEEITEVVWFKSHKLNRIINNTFPSIIEILKKSNHLK